MRFSRLLAALAAVTALFVGIRWGSFVAGGSDSYCYLNEAALFASGRTSMGLTLAVGAPWTSAAAFVPVGHRLAAPGVPISSSDQRHASIDEASPEPGPSAVPICPPGLPLLMALAWVVAGKEAAFFVAPVLGALAVWLTFLLGQRVAGSVAGAGAAVLLTCSPIFLYQIVQPMTDVPASTWWLAAIVLAAHRTVGASAAAGTATGLALMTRPNLFLLTPILATYVALGDVTFRSHARSRSAPSQVAWRQMMSFVLAMLPWLLGLAWVQNEMYGSPLAVGYGRPGELYAVGNILRNLKQYPMWLVETHTWFILLGLGAIFLPRAGHLNDAELPERKPLIWLCLSMSAAVLVSYLPYFQFQDWWYIRFLLPAIPLLLVLSMSVVTTLAALLPERTRIATVAFVLIGIGALWVRTAQERKAFDLQEYEGRFSETGRFVDRELPRNAAVMTVSQSGSVQFYSHRPTLVWDSLQPEDLDHAIAFLAGKNYAPFILLEADEEPLFKARFSNHSRLGQLDWPPYAELRTMVRVRIYDPADRARYLEGVSMVTKYPLAGSRRAHSVMRETALRRTLLGLTLVVGVWAVAIAITGGFSARILGVTISSHRATLPSLLALILFLGLFARWGIRSITSDLEATWSAPSWVWHVWTGLASLATLLVGIGFGTFAASGADAYGYISQSTLWLTGTFQIEQPISREVSWPEADWTFSPLGYRPALSAGSIVPTYPPGLPLLMALARTLAGDEAVYLVVPVLGAAAVWLTFALGRIVDGPRTGAVAAVLLAFSPVFLFQIVQPLSDIPVTAVWLTVLVLVARPGARRSIAAGLAASLAVVIRPNLAPVVIVPLAWVLVQHKGTSDQTLLKARALHATAPALGFILGLAPGVVLIAALQTFWYGSPVLSGHGTVGEFFSIRHFLPNVERFGSWALTTETPVILLALLAPALLKRSQDRDREVAPRDTASRAIAAVAVLAFAACVVACYLLYTPYDDWWYLRFLIPALPPVLVLSAIVIVMLVSRLPRHVRFAGLLLMVLALCSWYVHIARERGAFSLWRLERRYVVAGAYVGQHLPDRAVPFAVQQSGSIRHYSARITLRWDALDPRWLERAVSELRDNGYFPYFLLEDWEEAAFRARFAPVTQLGQLDWPPRAEIRDVVTVRIYDPADRARFFEGTTIQTDRQFTSER